MKNAPIGLFDSGVGGTTVWKEIIRQLPLESTIYLADNLHAPYGGKSKQEIIDLCKKNTEWLISKHCKLIIVSCNTATTSAIGYLRTHYDIPFVGVEPAVKPALTQTKTNTIGVLATEGTLASDLFAKTSELFSPHITLITQKGDGLVELIESGEMYSTQIKELLLHYLEPMIASKIDYLVLGCTHYPIIKSLIKQMLPPNVIILDSSEAIARQTKHILQQKKLLIETPYENTHQFYATSKTKVLKLLVENIVKNTSVFLISI